MGSEMGRTDARPSQAMHDDGARDDSRAAARSGLLPVQGAELHWREIGDGPPLIVLHGGPDFSHDYLLPEMDRLADSFRLFYYDQRGRGRSRGDVRPEDVGLASEIADVESVRRFVAGPDSAALLGHSWGALLAIEYAIRHPESVSHLILLDPAPASRDDFERFRRERRRTAGEDLDRLAALASTPRYQEGDLEADAEYYRIHFRSTLRPPDLLERVVERLRKGFTPEGIRRARAIEQRLYAETWCRPDYDRLPRLAEIRVPALVLHGDADFIPIECAAHIAEALPNARLVVLPGCGHFSYLECPDRVHQEIVDRIR